MAVSDYRVTFKAIECTTLDIKAASPEEALSRAREHWDSQHICIGFGRFAGYEPLQSIRVDGPDRSLEWLDPEHAAAADMLDALRLARKALDAGPCFNVPGLTIDSHAIAALCGRIIAGAEANSVSMDDGGSREKSG